MQESLVNDWLIDDWQFDMQRLNGVWRNGSQKENGTDKIHGGNIFVGALGNTWSAPTIGGSGVSTSPFYYPADRQHPRELALAFQTSYMRFKNNSMKTPTHPKHLYFALYAQQH